MYRNAASVSERLPVFSNTPVRLPSVSVTRRSAIPSPGLISEPVPLPVVATVASNVKSTRRGELSSAGLLPNQTASVVFEVTTRSKVARPSASVVLLEPDSRSTVTPLTGFP